MEEKKYTLLPADDAVQNWFEENIDKECSASSAIYKFRLWLESLQDTATKGTAAGREEVLQHIKDFNLSDVDAPAFTHTKEFEAHFSYIKGKLMDLIRKYETKQQKEK